jgi:hypothetical protein
LKSDDDYPDFIIPLARAVAAGTVERGVGIWSERKVVIDLTRQAAAIWEELKLKPNT